MVCKARGFLLEVKMIRIGPAGSGGLGNIAGLKMLKKLGLNAMEIEFTYGVRMSKEQARKIGRLARKLGISLSVHAPYYINLASYDKKKVFASRCRIIQSCRIACELGAKYVVFHPGFYQERTNEETYRIVKKELRALFETLKKKRLRVMLAPETTGKPSQFGSLDELLALRKETGSGLCVDFAHMLAREGNVNYGNILNKLKGIKHIHSHFSGIEFGKKGERRHLLTEKNAIADLFHEIRKRKTNITIINESPDPVGDSVKALRLLGKK